MTQPCPRRPCLRRTPQKAQTRSTKIPALQGGDSGEGYASPTTSRQTPTPKNFPHTRPKRYTTLKDPKPQRQGAQPMRTLFLILALALATTATLAQDTLAAVQASQKSLDDDQRERCVFTFDDERRVQWSFFPGPRPGVLRQAAKLPRRAAPGSTSLLYRTFRRSARRPRW